MSVPPAIEVRGLHTRVGHAVIHRGVDLTVAAGELFGIAGPSGCGKTTLLRQMVKLLPFQSGELRVLGVDLARATPAEAATLRRRSAMMFQGGALFSGLSVAENVALPLQEHTRLDRADIAALARIKMALAGLPADAADKLPAQLSGGLRKRAALARALALDPELLLLDEPSAGLDPVAAAALDDLLLGLKESLKLTIIVVTHDLDMLWHVTDRVAVMGEGRVLGLGTMRELAALDLPGVREYFHGPRGRTAENRAWNHA